MAVHLGPYHSAWPERAWWETQLPFIPKLIPLIIHLYMPQSKCMHTGPQAP